MKERKERKYKTLEIILYVLGGIFTIWLFFWTQMRHNNKASMVKSVY